VEDERKLGFGTSGRIRARTELRRNLRGACETRPRVGERSFEEAIGVLARGPDRLRPWTAGCHRDPPPTSRCGSTLVEQFFFFFDIAT